MLACFSLVHSFSKVISKPYKAHSLPRIMILKTWQVLPVFGAFLLAQFDPQKGPFNIG
jgi:hypothetical protein